MKAERLAIPDVILVTPPRHGDARGFLSETWKQGPYAKIGIPGPFVQDNHAFSADRGVVRGLHLQIDPHPQGKLVRAIRGAIFDVAVDVRHGSPSFGRHVSAVLSAENWQQLWVPPGFLHGYCTLDPDCEVIYKVTGPYDRAAERGVLWSDPALGIEWPVGAGEAILSDKDRVLPVLGDCPVWFRA